MSDDKGFPIAALGQILAGFVLALGLVHLLDYDPATELPTASAAGEPDPAIRALAPERGASERRIFCVGASLTAGYPYGGYASFARQMHVGLEASHPEAEAFVHEYAKPALDSRELATIVDRILERYDPSLICVTLGSNEFANRIFSGEYLVPPTLLGKIGERASRARVLFRMLPRTGSLGEESALQKQLQQRIFDAEVGKPVFDALPVPERDTAILVRRMRRMMRRMSRACADKDVPLVFLVAVYGLGGFWPWGISGEKVPEIDALVRATWTGFDAQVARGMRPRVESLLERYAQRADLQFLHGMVLREVGELAAARAAFERARDRDTVPMHQTGPMRLAIYDVARELGRPCFALDDAFVTDGSPLPDVREYLDYGHLSAAGNRRAAAWLVEHLVSLGHLPPMPDGWRVPFEAAARARVAAATSRDDMEEMARPNIAASNANFSMLFGNFRDALPWLETCVSKYVVKHPTYVPLKAQLLQCVFQMNGNWARWRRLPQSEQAALGGKLDAEIVAASKDGDLWSWIFSKLDEKD